MKRKGNEEIKAEIHVFFLGFSETHIVVKISKELMKVVVKFELHYGRKIFYF